MTQAQHAVSRDRSEPRDVEEGTLRRLAETASNPIDSDATPTILHDVLSSMGRLLDPNTQEFMQSRFGRDFPRVRIHTGQEGRAIGGGGGARASLGGIYGCQTRSELPSWHRSPPGI